MTNDDVDDDDAVAQQQIRRIHVPNEFWFLNPILWDVCWVFL